MSIFRMESLNHSDFKNHTESSNTTRECMYHNRTSPILQTVVDIEKYVVPALIWFGIVTNILTLLTLRSPKLKESPYVYLSALAVADLTALALMFTDLLITEFELLTLVRIKVNYPLTNLAATVAVNVMMVMTIERCVFVQFPLKAPVMCTVYRARLHVIIIVFISCVINLPRFFWYEMQWCFKSTLEKNVPQVIEHLDQHTASAITWIHSAIHNFIPFFVMILMNPFLVYKVRLQHKKRCSLGVRNRSPVSVWSREQLRLTTTLIAIIFLFIVLVLPSAFADDPILRCIMGARHFLHNGQIYQRLSNVLMLMNLSSNFILYAYINTKFFGAFKLMLVDWKICCVYRVTGKRYPRKCHRPHSILKKDSSLAISIQRDTSFSGLSA